MVAEFLILAGIVCSDHGARCQEGDGDYAYPCAEEKLPALLAIELSD
jgi:hypothetical protein